MVIEINEWSYTSSPYVPSDFGQTKFLFLNIYERVLIHSGRVINASESRLTLKECYRYFSLCVVSWLRFTDVTVHRLGQG
jgi:hypothetical protein